MLYFGVLGYFFGLGLLLPFIGLGSGGSFSERLLLTAVLGAPIVWGIGMIVGALVLGVAESQLEVMHGRSQSKEETRSNMLQGVLFVAGVVAYGLWLASGPNLLS